MRPLFVILLLCLAVCSGQHVQTFYSTPVASYSTQYNINPNYRQHYQAIPDNRRVHTVPAGRQIRPAPVTRFYPVTVNSAPVTQRPLIPFHQVPTVPITPRPTIAPSIIRVPAPSPIRVEVPTSVPIVSHQISHPHHHVTHIGTTYVTQAPRIAPQIVHPQPIVVLPPSIPARIAQPAPARIAQPAPARIAHSAPARVSQHRTRSSSYSHNDGSYSFSYDAGTHSRSEHRDVNGRVTGSYEITLADGRKRIVVYEADHNGYRAKVITNEPGTQSKSPADVLLSSSALPPTRLDDIRRHGQTFESERIVRLNRH